MRKIIVNNQEVKVEDMLHKFTILQMPSSNVEFFGTDGNDVFVQFKNGKSYLYKNVSYGHILEMRNTESIGKFIGVLSKNYTYVPVEQRLVHVVPAIHQQ